MTENQASTDMGDKDNRDSQVKVKSAGQNIKQFFSLDRVIGIIAVIVLFCTFLAWVSVPIAKNIGIKVSMSVPNIVNTASVVVDKADNAQDLALKMNETATVVKQIASRALDIKENVTQEDVQQNAQSAVKNIASSVVNRDEGVSATDAIKSTVTDAVNEKIDAETEIIESAAEEASANDEVHAKLAKADEMLALTKKLISIVSVIWYLGPILLLVTAVLLLFRIRGRFVTGIIAFTYVGVFSLAAIIALGAADKLILGALTDAVGSWILMIIPSVLSVTFWPWFVLLVCVFSITALAVYSKKVKKADAPNTSTISQ